MQKNTVAVQNVTKKHIKKEFNRVVNKYSEISVGGKLMIDFHSHFLPEMDDGSSSVHESIQMLKLSFDMGIDTMISTSHYYSNCENVNNFLGRRDAKLQKLKHSLESINDIPQIVMGAEVAFFSGMSDVKELRKLCIGNTNYMLLEMPFCEWSSLTTKELIRLINNRGIIPIIAHVERYFSHRQKKVNIEELLSLGVAIQTNAGALINSSQKRSILKLLDAGKIHLLGSDCHNMTERRPNLDSAIKIIQKEIGSSCVKRIDLDGRKILAEDVVT